jgi:cell division protein FtsL
VLAVVLLVAIGGVRVALSAATVSSLETTSSLRSEISDAKDLNSELQIERSVDASAQRIIRIATENYGMILATNVDSISIGSAQQASTNDQSDSAESGQAASDATDGQQDASTDASSDAGSSDAADADSGESSESSSPSAEVTTASEASSDSSVDDATGDTSATLTSQDEAVLSNLSPSNAGANAVSEAELENAA